MNLYTQLERRETPIRCAVIGCGKFATMFLSQAHRLKNLDVATVVDLAPERGRDALIEAGFAEERIRMGVDGSPAAGRTLVTDDVQQVFDDPRIDVVVEATGSPIAGTRHALAAIAAGKHVVMVTVEADVLVGPLLARKAAEAGVIYSMAYGDQPALVCELVDWARTTGFEVVAAGKGTKFVPEYLYSTPDTVWAHYGFTDEYATESRLNPQMFNSFLDGTKSAIEMAAVANATLLAPQDIGLQFPPCGVDQLASVCIPDSAGGVLQKSGTVEVVSSLERDGSPVDRDLRWGVYVSLEAPSDYVVECFKQYGVVTDPTGRYTAMYRPFHLIGLELAVSVTSAVLRGEPTGAPRAFVADVASIAKRDLQPGDILDGEGGYTVHGGLVSSGRSLADGLLPIGLAHGAKVVRDVPRGAAICWSDVAVANESDVTRLRRQLEHESR